MGFTLTAYFNDAGIASTNIVVSDIVDQENITKHYGDTYYSKDNFTGTATIMAHAKTGYKFKQWVYRIGGDAGAQQTSTDNPFIYKGSDHNNAELIIRAESEVGAKWTVVDQNMGYIPSGYEGEPLAEINIRPKTIYRFACQFSYAGTARFHTSGRTAPVCYISTAKDFHEGYGEPSFPDYWGSGGGYDGNFLLDWPVAANTTYYFWVRGPYNDTAGTTYLYIDPPEGSGSGGSGTDYWEFTYWYLTPGTPQECFIDKKLSGFLFPLKFTTSGKVSFYAASDKFELEAYLISDMDEIDFKKGTADTYLQKDSGAVLFDWTATSGTQYYVLVRGIDGTETGIFTAVVSAPQPATLVPYWDWYESNGYATGVETEAAFRAVADKGPVSEFSYHVWNDMCDKVDAVLKATDDVWLNEHASFSSTKMTADDHVLTAKRFNSLRYNIGSRYSTGIYSVDPDDKAYGEYFLTLAECINAWIAQIST